MIDQLIGLAKNSLGGMLTSEAGIKGDEIDKTMDVAKESVLDGLKEQALNGGMASMLSMFNGKEKSSQSNPIVSTVSKIFVSKAVEKLGFSNSKATLICNLVIPFIMEKFSDKDETGEAEDESGLMSMIGLDKDNAISGLLSGGSSMLGGLFG